MLWRAVWPIKLTWIQSGTCTLVSQALLNLPTCVLLVCDLTMTLFYACAWSRSVFSLSIHPIFANTIRKTNSSNLAQHWLWQRDELIWSSRVPLLIETHSWPGEWCVTGVMASKESMCRNFPCSNIHIWSIVVHHKPLWLYWYQF